MPSPKDANRSAAFLYILLAFAAFALWARLLFFGNRPGITSIGILRFVIVDGSGYVSYRWLLCLPFVFLAMAKAHGSTLPQMDAGPSLLLVLGISLAIVSWTLGPFEFGLGTLFPVYFAFKSMYRRRQEKRVVPRL